MFACLPGDAPPSSPPFRLRNKLDPEATAGYQDSAYNFGMMVQQRPLTTADFMKFVFFEKLFYLIDHDSNGYVTLIEMDKLLQFLALELDEGARMHMLLTLDDESDADDDELRLNTILNKFGQPSPSERAVAAVTPDDERDDAWASPRPRTDSLPRTPTRRKAAFSSQTTAFAKRRRRVSFSLKTFDASDVTDLVARMQPPASPPRVPFWRANLEE